jgi:hypothetical protein
LQRHVILPLKVCLHSPRAAGTSCNSIMNTRDGGIISRKDEAVMTNGSRFGR